MKKRIISFMLILFACMTSVINAEEKKDKEQGQSKYHIVFVRTGSDISKDKPRMPAKVSDIECYYCDGIIYVSFEEPEGDATLRIEDIATSDHAVFSFSTSTPFTVNIGEVTGAIQLEISTSEGNNYIGYLTE